MDQVKVYYFTKYNIVTNENKRMPRPATLEAIAAAEGMALEETVQEVDPSHIDGNGFLKT
jgi:hypothetical protein